MPAVSGFPRGRAIALAALLSAILNLAPTLSAHAQTQGPEGQHEVAQPSQTIAATADNRITIDVAVTDKLDHHVAGLQAGDFTLLDNKTPQKIIGFRDLGDRNFATDPVHILIVVDTINTGFEEVAWERQQLDAFLKQDGGKLENPTSIAFLTENGVEMQRAPSQDGNQLIVGFDQAQTGLRGITRSAGFYGAVERMQMSLEQIAQLISVEDAFEGRKLMLVIGGGWQLLSFAGEEEDTQQEEWVFNRIVWMTNRLRQSRITLYCLDPFELGRTDPYYYQAYLKGVALERQAQYPDLALQVLAEHSGGEVMIKGKDITGDLNLAERDASAGYELTFAAPPGDRLNEYHALQVEVGKPQVKVRTVSGYYARPQPEGAKKKRH